MSTSNGDDASFFRVRNHHSAECGDIPPHVDDSRAGRYRGYFENEHREQAMFVYDRDSNLAVVYLGDAGWEARHSVVDGGVPDLIVSETEQLWVRACWQAATANRKEA